MGVAPELVVWLCEEPGGCVCVLVCRSQEAVCVLVCRGARRPERVRSVVVIHSSMLLSVSRGTWG